MNKFNQSKQKEQLRSSFRNSKALKAITGIALTASLVGMESEIASAGEVHTQSSAKAIAKELNENKVAKNVVVELGYQIPVKYDKNSTDTQPMAIMNPIKLSKDTYAYIVDNPTDSVQAQKVELHTVHYDKPLQLMQPSKDYPQSKEFSQEIVTSIASVYYQGSTSTGSPNYFNWVTIGDKSGNVLKLTNTSAPSNSAAGSAEIEQQIVSMPYVGSMSYYAPRG
jgi:hypothetical protein